MIVNLKLVDTAKAREKTATIDDNDMIFIRNFMTVFDKYPELFNEARKDWRKGIPFKWVSGSQTLTITAVPQ